MSAHARGIVDGLLIRRRAAATPEIVVVGDRDSHVRTPSGQEFGAISGPEPGLGIMGHEAERDACDVDGVDVGAQARRHARRRADASTAPPSESAALTAAWARRDGPVRSTTAPSRSRAVTTPRT